MTELPLQTSLATRPKPEKERISSVISSSMMCGVLVFDGVAHLHYILILMVGFVCLCCMTQLAMRHMIAIALISFTAGAGASQIEQFIKQKQLIVTNKDHDITATIIDSERQQNQRARLWLTNITSKEPIGKGGTIDKGSIIRATIDQMPDGEIAKGTIFSGQLRLYPLSAPLFKGWPDYARKSWSEGIIGTAYGRAPKISLPQTNQLGSYQAKGLFDRLRAHISSQVSADLSANNASLALALFIGERDFSNRAFYEPFRQSGLAHLLAISGLHMGLFCFGVYGLFRLILALPLRLSAYVGHHKIAAILALISGGFYLCLAQMPLSAIRAYLMTSLILLALLWGRRTVTLRNVNIVFILFLLLSPSSLYVPAFQLSFAATFAIVVFHEYMRRHHDIMAAKWLRRLSYLIATSLVAIISTFFITAFHFGTFTIWGVMANIFAIPYTGLVVMPVGVIYLLSLMVGLGDVIAPLLNLVLGILITFAQKIASLPFSNLALTVPPPVYLPLFGLGFLWLYLASPRWRLIIICKGVLLVVLWLGQIAPIGAIRASDSRFYIAVIDNGTLTHSHRLTSFWANSYQKLLGHYHTQTQVKCRYQCQITLLDDQVIMVDTTIKKMACPKGAGLLVARRSISCPHYQTLVLKDTDIQAILYYNNQLGYYLKENNTLHPKRPWHP